MSQGRPLNAKLFLEGKEVPFIGATITHTVNQASIAYIDLVPNKEILAIKPRTMVHLFVRNFQDPQAGNSGNAAFPYVLAWEGEVFGFTFGKTPSSRNFSISCIDYSSYWDNVLAYFFNPQQSLGAGANSIASTAYAVSDNKKTNIPTKPVVEARASFFVQKIGEVLKKEGTDFLDAFIAVIEDFTKINDFYLFADERLRINDRILLHSSKMLDKLLVRAEALEWFTGIVGRTSGYSSLRMIIQDLLSLIFHDGVAIPFPARVKSDIKKPLPSTAQVKKTIGSFIFKPNLYMFPPPMCNVFFPDEYSNFQYSRNFFQEPTRLIYQPELPRKMGNTSVSMPHVYEPPVFANFMLKTEKADVFKGVDSLETPLGAKDPGSFYDDDKSASAEINNGKLRQAQFLTNEERIKGIWMTRESMMPATTQFSQGIDEHGAGRAQFTQGVAKYLFYKKRFQNRQLQITSQLKISVVPGFPVLLLDDGDTDQNVVAYCSSVTHRIYATEGGYTNVSLTYARNVSEQDNSSNHGTQMLIPPWFEESIFGKMEAPPPSEAAPDEVRARGVAHVSPNKLSDFFKTLLGDLGATALTNRYPQEKTLIGAVRKLQQEYRKERERGMSDLQAFIAKETSRDYVKLGHAFDFLGATSQTKDHENTSFLEFTGDSLTRKGKPDADAMKTRQDVIDSYRHVLKTKRGFRG